MPADAWGLGRLWGLPGGWASRCMHALAILIQIHACPGMQS
jgi:hypothetical protein